jgi:hypothetical protein
LAKAITKMYHFPSFYVGVIFNATVHALDAGHWPQIDEPAEIARIMLANQ